MHVKDDEYYLFPSYDIIHRYMRNNDHKLIIIQVNLIFKEIYFYCLTLDTIVVLCLA
jgi:hypothetical protein